MRGFEALVLLAFFCMALPAGALDREQKLRALMDAQGLTATFEQQLQMSKEAGRAQAEQTIRQMLSALNPPPEFESRFRRAAEEYLASLQPKWSAQEAVAIWTQYYGPNFSDTELDELLAFYSSPLAQKEATASRQALVQFTRYAEEQNKPLMEKATQAFITRTQQLVKECNCAK
jgi:hypothetical protein